MKARHLFLIAAASLLIPITSAIAFAQTPPSESFGQSQFSPPPRGDKQGANSLPPWANDINLTDAQKQQLKALHEQARKDAEPLGQQLREADEKMRSLLASDTSNEQLRQQHQKIQALRQQLDNKRFETMLAERQILTPEQRTQLSQLMQQRFRRPQQ
ncbi:MAG TPA: Spy/CpxP family protein refolding chaperone [Nostocaceae cyanobacterium]|nr:Spy/CpxP family protein refolding chaperone [Nostocaceae cyanobacterium]